MRHKMTSYEHYWFQMSLDWTHEGVWYIPFDAGPLRFTPNQQLKWSIHSGVTTPDELRLLISTNDTIAQDDDTADVHITTSEFYLLEKFGKWYGKVVWIIDHSRGLKAYKQCFPFDGIVSTDINATTIEMIRTCRSYTVKHWSAPTMPKHHILWPGRLKLVYAYERPTTVQIRTVVSPSMVVTIKYLERVQSGHFASSPIHIQELPHPQVGNDVCRNEPWRSWVLEQQQRICDATAVRAERSFFKSNVHSGPSRSVRPARPIRDAASNAHVARPAVATTERTGQSTGRHCSV